MSAVANSDMPLRHTQLSGEPLPDEALGKVDAAFQTLQKLCHGKTFLICLDDVSIGNFDKA